MRRLVDPDLVGTQLYKHTLTISEDNWGNEYEFEIISLSSSAITQSTLEDALNTALSIASIDNTEFFIYNAYIYFYQDGESSAEINMSSGYTIVGSDTVTAL